MPDRETSAPPERRHFRWRGPVLTVLVVISICIVAGLYLPQTNLVPQAVDFVRALPFVGPDRMAALENAYYDAQDAVTQFIYDRTHAPVVVADVSRTNLTATPVRTPSPSVAPPRALTSPRAPVTHAAPTVIPAAPTVTPTLSASPTPAPLPPIIISDPQAGEGIWTTANLPLGDQKNPPLWHTFYRPDPARPYARVDLVRMDLSQTELTMVQGTNEPRPIDGIRGSGVIPNEVQMSGKLLAAWNGGFLTIHGAYGMMLNRRVILPPRDGFATLAQYADGSLKLGVWGQEITMTPDLVSFRENGPILIDHGVLNDNGLLSWGKSVSGETHIWRSGLGLTADGSLIFAAGNALDAQTLGEALLRAGAVEAMQLDVNAWHVYFFTYTLTPNGLVPTKLNTTMPGPTRVFLTPFDRDFMYLTLKGNAVNKPPLPFASP
jgi:Phosphodiester glycosidase